MAIIGTLPNNIQDGQVADAVPVMADFNFIVNQVNANAAPLGQLTAASSTGLAFYQATAPVGWVQVAGVTDHTIQLAAAGGVVSGTNPYSSLFNFQWTTDGHALVTAEMPVHNHPIIDPGHTHGVTDPTHVHTLNGDNVGGGGAPTMSGASSPTTATTLPASTGISINATTTGITTGNTGSGTAHSHTKTFASQYVQMILCTHS